MQVSLMDVLTQALGVESLPQLSSVTGSNQNPSGLFAQLLSEQEALLDSGNVSLTEALEAAVALIEDQADMAGLGLPDIDPALLAALINNLAPSGLVDAATLASDLSEADETADVGSSKETDIGTDATVLAMASAMLTEAQSTENIADNAVAAGDTETVTLPTASTAVAPNMTAGERATQARSTVADLATAKQGPFEPADLPSQKAEPRVVALPEQALEQKPAPRPDAPVAFVEKSVDMPMPDTTTSGAVMDTEQIAQAAQSVPTETANNAELPTEELAQSGPPMPVRPLEKKADELEPAVDDDAPETTGAVARNGGRALRFATTKATAEEAKPVAPTEGESSGGTTHGEHNADGGDETPEATFVRQVHEAVVAARPQTPAPAATSGTQGVEQALSSVARPSETAASHAAARADRTEFDPAPRVATLDRVYEAAIRSVHHMVRQGEQVIRVRLVPASLGEVQFEVVQNGNELSIHMTAANSRVREALELQVANLRDSLTQDGLTIDKVSVSTNMGSTHHFAGSQGQRHPSNLPQFMSRPAHSQAAFGALPNVTPRIPASAPTNMSVQGLNILV